MTSLVHFLQFHYWPHGTPWYTGADWSNVFAVAILAPLGWFWSRTKFWPLRPIRHGLTALHSKLDVHRDEMREHLRTLHDRHDAHAGNLEALAERVEELHAKLDGKSATKRTAPSRAKRS